MSEPQTPAESRLLALLLFLREEAPQATDDFKQAVMRAARREHLVRAALAALEDLMSALAHAVAVVLGLSSPRTAAT
jgi:hypothetical protein